MDTAKLKKYLISTGYFIDNLFLQQYLNLINTYQTSHSYTEGHHIIPVSFYKCYYDNYKKYNRYKLEKLAEQDSNNAIIYLSYKDHCIAHYLLYNCTIGSLKYAMKTCYTLLYKNNNKELSEHDLIALENYYDELCIKIDLAKLREIYLSSNYSVTAVADYFKVSRKFARNKLIAVNLYRQKVKAPIVTAELIKKLMTDFDFIQYAKTHSQSDTAKKFGYTKYEVQRIMAKLNIKNYDFLNANKNAAWNNGLTKSDAKFYSKALCIKLAANKGKVLSTKQKQKLSNACTTKKKVLCLELNKVFSSITDAAKAVNLHPCNIIVCCKNSSKVARGYHWKYLE